MSCRSRPSGRRRARLLRFLARYLASLARARVKGGERPGLATMRRWLRFCLLACTAPGFGAGSDLRLGRPGTCSRIVVHDSSSALSDRDPDVRLARTAGRWQASKDAEIMVSGTRCRCCGGRLPGRSQTGPAGQSWPPWPGCSRRRYGATGSFHARDAAGLAPPPGHAGMDISESAGALADQSGNQGPRAAARAGEPGLGVPQSPRGIHQARPPHQRGDL